MDLLGWVVLGIVCGWLGGKPRSERDDDPATFLCVLVGGFGAVLGGWAVAPGDPSFLMLSHEYRLGTLFGALVGALVLVALFRAIYLAGTVEPRRPPDEAHRCACSPRAEPDDVDTEPVPFNLGDAEGRGRRVGKAAD